MPKAGFYSLDGAGQGDEKSAHPVPTIGVVGASNKTNKSPAEICHECSRHPPVIQACGASRAVRLVPQHQPAGAPHVLELQDRLRSGRHGHADAQLRRADADCNVGHHYGRSGADSHQHPDRVGDRRLGRRDSFRPHRPRAHAATDGAVVRLLHFPLRLRAKLRTTADRPDLDGLRFRR